MNLSILTTAVFNSNGIWTKHTDAKLIDIIIIGGGGGGGSGADGAITRQGGNGGNPGSVFYLNKMLASSFETNVVITVGVGGVGGTAVSNHTGVTGSDGTASMFGSYVASGGYGGIGGFIGYTFINLNVSPIFNGVYNSTSDFYYPFDGFKGMEQYSTTTVRLEVVGNSLGYFNAPVGGGLGGAANNLGFVNVTSSPSIYNPFLIYSTAVAVFITSIAINGNTGVTFNSYFGTGGSGAVTPGTQDGDVSGYGGRYGGGGGGGAASGSAGTISGLGGDGQNGVIVVTTYV